MLSLVVTTDVAGNIGYKGKLPWKIEREMKWFKDLTTGSVVIMGYNTWKSIGHPLKDRINIVISVKHHEECLGQDGPHFFNSLEAGIGWLCRAGLDNLFLIGGKQLYDYALDANVVSEIYMSVIKDIFIGDTFFSFDKLKKYKWEEQIIEHQEFIVRCMRKLQPVKG